MFLLHISLIRYAYSLSKLKMWQTTDFRASCMFIQLSLQDSYLRVVNLLSFIFLLISLLGECLSLSDVG